MGGKLGCGVARGAGSVLVVSTLAAGVLWGGAQLSSARSNDERAAANVQDDKRRPVKVKGTATLRFFAGEDCAPHPGTCLKGTTTGDLAGDVLVRIFTREVVEGSARTVSVASADITITRPDGRLDGAAAGFTDTTTGEFRNVTPWVGGTGRYASADGFVRFEGRTDFATGIAHETYRGTLYLR